MANKTIASYTSPDGATASIVATDEIGDVHLVTTPAPPKKKADPPTVPKVDSTTLDGGVVSWTASKTAGATVTATIKPKA